jgi:hypothetical protein
MKVEINETPFCLKGLDSLDIRLAPLQGQEILRAQDGSLLYAPDDARMEIILQGKGHVHPSLADVRKGEKFTLSHPLPLWTRLETPPRNHAGSLILREGQRGYFPIFSCILSDFEIQTDILDLKVNFKFVFQEI